MQNDNQDNTIEMLIRYIDNELSDTEKAATEKLLQEDAALQERLQNLVASKQAIRSLGIKQQVQLLQQEYLNEVTKQETPTAKVIKASNPLKAFMRIAAALILVVAGYGVYQYTATTNSSLYEDNFISYQLPVTRGNVQETNIDSLYHAKRYDAVIAAVSAKQSKTQEDYFLAAQSALMLNNANAAIEDFQKIELLNNNSSDKYFAEETDYYLALAYIKANRIEEAKKQLEKITSNRQHAYYNKAKEISSMKLTILEWKK